MPNLRRHPATRLPPQNFAAGQTDKRLGLADHPDHPATPATFSHVAPRSDSDKDPYPSGARLFGSTLVGHVDPKALRKRWKTGVLCACRFSTIRQHTMPISSCPLFYLGKRAIRRFRSQEAFAWTQAKTPVVAPRHESRPDLEIIFDLAVRLGLDMPFFGGDQEAAWNHYSSPTGLTMADSYLRRNTVRH